MDKMKFLQQQLNTPFSKVDMGYSKKKKVILEASKSSLASLTN